MENANLIFSAVAVFTSVLYLSMHTHRSENGGTYCRREFSFFRKNSYLVFHFYCARITSISGRASMWKNLCYFLLPFSVHFEMIKVWNLHFRVAPPKCPNCIRNWFYEKLKTCNLCFQTPKWLVLGLCSIFTVKIRCSTRPKFVFCSWGDLMRKNLSN